MKNLFTFLFSIVVIIPSWCQGSASQDTVTLIFAGDIMGHDSQIESAYDSLSGTYDYEKVFASIAPFLKSADFAIANLECTLAGKPYKGYPRFSSPDELAAACLNNGINILMTANNHSCDRGRKGITRTLNVLDFLGIRHTGTFRDSADRDSSNLLILKKGKLRIGVLNYTYGTNGLPVNPPAIVNLIDTVQIKKDITAALTNNPDKLIIMLHWGQEYRSFPDTRQKQLAEYLFDLGVDVIIGSHPHIIQPMKHRIAKEGMQERMIVYSLGNFVSNQRKRKTDGGALIKIAFTKNGGQTTLLNYGYYLTWVHKFMDNGKWKFEILPCRQVEQYGYKNPEKFSLDKMKLFIDDTHDFLQKENINVKEIIH